jgi:hypothetical protein
VKPAHLFTDEILVQCNSRMTFAREFWQWAPRGVNDRRGRRQIVSMVAFGQKRTSSKSQFVSRSKSRLHRASTGNEKSSHSSSKIIALMACLIGSVSWNGSS